MGAIRVLSDMRMGFALGILALGLISCDSQVVRANTIAFELPSDDGDLIRFPSEAYAGKVVVIDLWGAWCIPCHEQTPHLVRLHRKYRDQGLEIIGVNFEIVTADAEDERVESLQRFREEYTIEYTLVSGGAMADIAEVLPDLKNVQGLPVTIAIARDGRVAFIETGFAEADAERIEARIQRLLDETAP